MYEERACNRTFTHFRKLLFVKFKEWGFEVQVENKKLNDILADLKMI